MNNLVEKDEKVEWDKINEDLRKYYVTTLLHTAEKETLALSAGYTHTMQMQVDAGEVGEALKPKTWPNTFHKKIYIVVPNIIVIIFIIIQCIL